jgi:hypothetical protein
MSSRLAWLLVPLCGCSLFVSTSGLSDGEVRGADGGGSNDGAVTIDARAPEGGSGDSAALPDASDAYSAAVLSDSPLAYMRLDDMAGTTARNSVPGAAATYVGTVKLGAAGAIAGNGAVELTDGWIDFGDNFAFAGDAPYTIELWMRPTVVNDTRFIFDRGPSTGSAPGEGYTAYYGTGYTLAARARVAGGEFGYVSTSASPRTDTWTHFVVSYDGSANRLFVDGVQIAVNGGGAIGTSSPGRFAVGNLARGQFNKFVGFIDEVAIYGRALSAARIAAHFAAAGR